MPLKAVCRLCLAMDAPMHNIADSPLRSVYEKLTDISLNTQLLNASIQPAVACYLCYCQLRKCHELMARSVRADRVLTQLLRSGEVGDIEVIKMKRREILQLNGLCLTPIKLIAVELPGHIPNTSLASWCKEEIDTDSRRCTDYLKVEQSEDEEIDSEIQRDGKSMENNSLLDGEEINEQSEDAVNIQEDRWTGPGDIKQEKPEEDGTYVQRFTGYLKFGDLEDHENIVIWRDVHNIKDERVTGGVETEFVESVAAVNAENVDVTGAAPTEKCKETLAEIIQDGQPTPGPSGKNIQEKLRTHNTITEEEATSRNIHVLHSTEKVANDERVLINTCMYSDTARSKSNNVSVNSDNGRTGTNTDGGNSCRKHLKRMFICNDCGKVFDDKYLLIEHIENHITVKRTNYRNSLLQRKQIFSRASVVNKHTETRSRMKPVECEICQRRFTEKWKFSRHLQIHTGIKPFACEICKVRFSRKDSLKKHLRVHTLEKPYECEICKVSFRRKDYLNTHIRFHTSETLKPFACEICKVTFSRKDSLKKHIRVHTKEKPYECKICKVRFSQMGHLNSHLRVHTKEKPYECEICKFRFSRKDSLKKHLRVHTKERPYECTICKVRFSEKGLLNTPKSSL